MFAHQELEGIAEDTGERVTSMHIVVGIDLFAGVIITAVAIEKLGGEFVGAVNRKIPEAFYELLNSAAIRNLSPNSKGSYGLGSMDIPVPPITTIYTDQLLSPEKDVANFSLLKGNRIKIVEEYKLYKSVFISYGGPDEVEASKINVALKSNGVKTWFFPDDCLPGQKLHRMMHEGVNSHDKILLVCSENSLNRNGVLNEIEKVLEKEAATGGQEVLIPITVDDYVFDEWSPSRSDIAQQVRSRVIKKVNLDNQEALNGLVEKILSVIRIV